MKNPNSNRDQADGLRKLQSPDAVRVIAVTSGKGGVGKTNISVNLACAMAGLGKSVLLFDADLGLANVDVLLGLKPDYDLQHVLSGNLTLEEIIIEGPLGIRIVPAATGIAEMAELSSTERAGLISAFSELSLPVDVMIVDTAAGIAGPVTTFAKASQEIIVVVCDEPASITDAYALIKVLSTQHDVARFHILANMVESEVQGKELFRKMVTATDRFLEVAVSYLGSVPNDQMLKRAVRAQSPVLTAYPRSPSAAALNRIAMSIDQWPLPQTPNGHIEFFLERLLQSDHSEEADV